MHAIYNSVQGRLNHDIRK